MAIRFLVVQDYKENRRKCTLTPLESHEDFTFVRLPRPEPTSRQPLRKFAIDRGLLLHVDAPPLAAADQEFLGEAENPIPVIVVDSTWARVPNVMARLEILPGSDIHRRSLPREMVTAYPRTSKLYVDPVEGLASVEAIFSASLILGEPRHEFLNGYRWRDEFLRYNHELFQQFLLLKR